MAEGWEDAWSVKQIRVPIEQTLTTQLPLIISVLVVGHGLFPKAPCPRVALSRSGGDPPTPGAL